MKARLTLYTLAAILLTACASAPPAPEEGPASAPPASPTGGTLEEQFVRQTVFSLRDSFVKRDTASFLKHVSEGFYLGRQRLQKGLDEAFAAPGVLGLAVEVAEVSINDPRVTALVRWQRSIDGAAAGAGTTELIFHKGDTVSLVNFSRDPLFGIAGF